MQLYINSITPDSVMRCKKGSDELLKYMELINPQVYENHIYYDVFIQLPDDFSISCKHQGSDEILIVTMSKLGDLELNTKDYRQVILI